MLSFRVAKIVVNSFSGSKLYTPMNKASNIVCNIFGKTVSHNLAHPQMGDFIQ